MQTHSLHYRSWLKTLATCLLIISLLLCANETQAAIAQDVSVLKLEPSTFTHQITTYGDIMSASVALSGTISANVLKIYFKGGELVHKGQTLYQLDNREHLTLYEASLAQLEIDKADYKAKFKVYQLNKYESISRHDLTAAKDKYQESLAAANQIKTQLDKLQVKAPITGIITHTDFNVGDLIQAGTVMAHIFDSKNHYIQYQISAVYRPHVQIDDTLQVSAGLNAKKTYTAKVTYISPNVSYGMLTLTAKIVNVHAYFPPGIKVKIQQNVGTYPVYALPRTIDLDCGAVSFTASSFTAKVVKNQHVQEATLYYFVKDGLPFDGSDYLYFRTNKGSVRPGDLLIVNCKKPPQKGDLVKIVKYQTPTQPRG